MAPVGRGQLGAKNSKVVFAIAEMTRVPKRTCQRVLLALADIGAADLERNGKFRIPGLVTFRTQKAPTMSLGTGLFPAPAPRPGRAVIRARPAPALAERVGARLASRRGLFKTVPNVNIDARMSVNRPAPASATKGVDALKGVAPAAKKTCGLSEDDMDEELKEQQWVEDGLEDEAEVYAGGREALAPDSSPEPASARGPARSMGVSPSDDGWRTWRALVQEDGGEGKAPAVAKRCPRKAPAAGKAKAAADATAMPQNQTASQPGRTLPEPQACPPSGTRCAGPMPVAKGPRGDRQRETWWADVVSEECGVSVEEASAMLSALRSIAHREVVGPRLGGKFQLPDVASVVRSVHKGEVKFSANISRKLKRRVLAAEPPAATQFAVASRQAKLAGKRSAKDVMRKRKYRQNKLRSNCTGVLTELGFVDAIAEGCNETLDNAKAVLDALGEIAIREVRRNDKFKFANMLTIHKTKCKRIKVHLTKPLHDRFVAADLPDPGVVKFEKRQARMRTAIALREAQKRQAETVAKASALPLP